MSPISDPSKQAADAITAVAAAATIFVGAVAVQAWLLTLILPWFGVTVSLGFFKAFIVCTFLNLLLK